MSRSKKTLGLLAAGIFAVAVCGYAFDPAFARGGHGGGGRGGGGHSHFKGGGSNKGWSNNNRNHHYNNDRWHNNYNHYGRWAAGTVAVGMTAAAVGSVLYSLPSGCRTVYSGGVKYWDCGGSWYQAQYQGSNIAYVGVPPR